jgi:hypothetical protein
MRNGEEGPNTEMSNVEWRMKNVETRQVASRARARLPFFILHSSFDIRHFGFRRKAHQQHHLPEGRPGLPFRIPQSEFRIPRLRNFPVTRTLKSLLQPDHPEEMK